MFSFGYRIHVFFKIFIFIFFILKINDGLQNEVGSCKERKPDPSRGSIPWLYRFTRAQQLLP